MTIVAVSQPQPSPSGALEWISPALNPGVILGSLAAGVMLWMPSHSLTTAVGAAVAMFIVIGGLRIADPYLQPVWWAIARVPKPVRVLLAAGMSIGFSISQFGPGAAGNEVSAARTALFVSVIVSYVLIRPDKDDSGG